MPCASKAATISSITLTEVSQPTVLKQRLSSAGAKEPSGLATVNDHSGSNAAWMATPAWRARSIMRCRKLRAQAPQGSRPKVTMLAIMAALLAA